jgi:hypothetical protein
MPSFEPAAAFTGYHCAILPVPDEYQLSPKHLIGDRVAQVVDFKDKTAIFDLIELSKVEQ